jgi:hypothetical protein
MTGARHEQTHAIPRVCRAKRTDHRLADRARLALFGTAERPRQDHRLLPEECQRDRTPLQPQDNRGRAGAGFPPQEGQPLNLLVAPDPIEIDPRPCDLCGLTIDRHDMVDDGDGPEFFCLDWLPDEMTLPELERRAEMRRQEEIAAIMARWEAMDEEISRRKAAPLPAPEPYRPAQSTGDAFRLLIKTGDAARARAWLADRPKDAPSLLLLLEG